ncbi:uncharacterized protein BT62DRAFT_1052045 [Guyanagaster necrorhizus]|uniref:MYND-type domain-containing protein n=1 Tax=Guyanagaster necrorhizus TaxID=856835 RepID=A0A9P8ALT5_9AGAR|nr:uncharacterized protein BT62DRAFT_1052045 [Guyanagaster necrorhizus MCA 3950]KAG7439971.1 hypothetical protein BT62DRAFT_1052045 [Guyanagaster necrorhizus MCA 3950]
MAVSLSHYAVDLEDNIAFPDIAHVPILPPHEKKNWYILTEIVSDETVFRPTFRVEDKLAGHYWVVAFYTENPAADAKECKVGHMICIKDGIPKQFLDGRYGYKIKDPWDVVILPCGLANLRELNVELRKRSDDGLFFSCVVCNSQKESLGCARCKTRYRSGECMKADWHSRHLQICKVLRTLHEWNRTPWG